MLRVCWWWWSWMPYRWPCCLTMPKEDKPPAYEEAISSTKYEDSRHHPPNGHHDSGVGPDPPTPPPAYSPGPGTYPRQPGYGGYPPAGSMVAGTVFPPAGMPPSIIPTLSAGVSDHSQGSWQWWLPRNTYNQYKQLARSTNKLIFNCYCVLRRRYGWFSKRSMGECFCPACFHQESKCFIY